MKRSVSSLAKLLTTRMPASESCSCALMPLIFLRLSLKTSRMRMFCQNMMTANAAVTTTMASASTGAMVKRITNEPIISMPQMMIHSGTWCAASQISNRSLTTRLIMSPELLRSKYAKLKRSYWSNRSSRILDSIRAPIT